MNNMIFGYARVSSKDQNEGRQLKALREAGVEERHIFVDKASGKDFNREQYRAMLTMLREGDCVYVMSIDRLGRNYKEILNEWRVISKEKGADIVVLDMPLLDTRKDKDLTGTLITDIVLQLLSYVAEKERESIKARQAEGIALAKARGDLMGRPQKEVDKEAFAVAYEAVKGGRMMIKAALSDFGVTYNTWHKLCKEYEEKSGRFEGK